MACVGAALEPAGKCIAQDRLLVRRASSDAVDDDDASQAPRDGALDPHRQDSPSFPLTRSVEIDPLLGLGIAAAEACEREVVDPGAPAR